MARGFVEPPKTTDPIELLEYFKKQQESESTKRPEEGGIFSRDAEDDTSSLVMKFWSDWWNGTEEKVAEARQEVMEMQRDMPMPTLPSIDRDRPLPDDVETPVLDTLQGQDIDATEDSIIDISKRIQEASVTTFAKPTDAPEVKDETKRTGIMSKPSADGVQPTDGKEDSDIVSFIKKLTISESSGDPTAEITIEDGRRFAGLLQFGEARLKDYKKATGEKFTQDDFIKDEALQEKVALWHIKDIDKLIDSIENKGKYTDRNGLRAVAHLGGKTGMKKFVKSQGKENPEDELGTSLQDYYDKFKAK